MLLVQKFTFNPIQENTYVLYAENGDCCIIDPGCYFEDEREALRRFIESKKLRPVYLLNTHCHLDHVFGNKFVSETWRLPLYLHEAEKAVLSFAPKSAEMYGLPFDHYEGAMNQLTPGDIIKIGTGKLKILFTPGHSPGSVSFYNGNDGYVISGDVLFSGSIGRTDLPGGNFEVLKQSIKTELYTLPDSTNVYPGHGGGTSIGFEKKNNPFVRED
ncbi:MBL fold metallo-hydrolase [Niabella aquatica]